MSWKVLGSACCLGATVFTSGLWDWLLYAAAGVCMLAAILGRKKKKQEPHLFP